MSRNQKPAQECGVPDNERDLFRDAVGPVRRIHSRRVESRQPPKPVEPVKSREDEQMVMSELAAGRLDLVNFETGEELNWLRPGLQKRVLMRLRRGHYTVRDELDLHHMNSEAAGKAIRDFLDEARERNINCIKIIHGKGLRSGPDGPKLRQLTGRILQRDARVLAFTGARPNDGGSGAVYVLLSNSR